MGGKSLCLAGVARYIGVSRRTLYNQLKDGRFPVRSIVGSNPRRWFVDDLDSWMRGQYETH